MCRCVDVQMCKLFLNVQMIIKAELNKNKGKIALINPAFLPIIVYDN